MADPNPQLRHEKIQHVAKQVMDNLKSQLYPHTELWIQNQLSPQNIPQIRNICTDLLGQVQAWGLANVETNLWMEVELMVEGEMRELCTAYLIKIETALDKFRGGIKKKFDLYFCFTGKELDDHFQGEYNKLSPQLLQETTDIQKLAELGCKKLMGSYRLQNSQINEAECKLASELLPEAKNFYNEQMGTFLAEGVNTQERLQELHKVLSGKLMDSFKMAFRYTGGGDRISPSVENKVVGLKSSLEIEFQKHLQKIPRTRQPDLNALLKKFKTEYEEKIKNLLQRHPDGLDPVELTKKHEEIHNEAKVLLKMETRGLGIDSRETAMDTFQEFVQQRFNSLMHENTKRLTEYGKQQQERNRGRESQRLRGQQPSRQAHEHSIRLDDDRKGNNGGCCCCG